MKANSVSTIELRLSALTWNYTQHGMPIDRKDRCRYLATTHYQPQNPYLRFRWIVQKKLLDNASGYKPVVFLWNLWTFSAINTTGAVNRSTLALGDNLFCPI